MTRHSAPVATDYDRPVTLKDFLLFLVRHKWLLLISGLIFATAAFSLAELLPPVYEASITVIPVTPSGSGIGSSSLSSALSHIGGLASIAGLNVGGTTGWKAEALATLKSRLLTNKFITQHNLMPVLFSKDWNSRTKKWRFRDPSKDPTLWNADQLFRRHIRSVEDNSRTGVVTMTIKWRNAQLAAQWANGLVHLTNEYLRQKTISETTRDLNYLRHAINTTTLMGVKNAIYTLMEQELKNQMIATSRKQFAFRIIDPAIPPRLKSSPKPLLWTIAGGLAGILIGILIAIVRETLLEDTPRATSSTENPPAPTSTADAPV